VTRGRSDDDALYRSSYLRNGTRASCRFRLLWNGDCALRATSTRITHWALARRKGGALDLTSRRSEISSPAHSRPRPTLKLVISSGLPLPPPAMINMRAPVH
jgi:hypothetical protein